MSKYVVKNCPCYVSIDSFENTCASLYTCESDTDCLIKQTIDLCKLQITDCNECCVNCLCDKSNAICCLIRKNFAMNILKKFEIEEIEDAGSF